MAAIMRRMKRGLEALVFGVALMTVPALLADGSPTVPRFALEHMDRSVAPGVDFFHFAAGHWLANNPVPPDKSRWGAFTQLQELNWHHLREILQSCAAEKAAARDSAPCKVGDFFASAMDTPLRM